MESEGHRCTSIRGDMDNELRDKVVNEFRNGTTKILISTDVLSRGFDVTQASHLTHTSLSHKIMCSFKCHRLQRYGENFQTRRVISGERKKCCLFYRGAMPWKGTIY